jgi:hypothetical protein
VRSGGREIHRGAGRAWHTDGGMSGNNRREGDKITALHGVHRRKNSGVLCRLVEICTGYKKDKNSVATLDRS